MKKFALFIIIFSTGLLTGTLGFSEEQDYERPRERREQGMMGGAPASMVALMDGSVVVLSGNKLTKYDPDLNIIKEVETKGGSVAMDRMDGMGRRKNSRIITEEKVDEFPGELSDSVPAMLEAAARPRADTEGALPEPEMAY